MDIVRFGEVQPSEQGRQSSLDQMKECMAIDGAVKGVLSADNHLGYSMPVGGTIAFRDKVFPHGVGYDIACGNKCVRTDLKAFDVLPRIGRVMDELVDRISFGVGPVNKEPVDHPVLDDPLWDDLPEVKRWLFSKARDQLGTVGSGNHFVDIFVEKETESVWIGNHFGSRGFGHGICIAFSNYALGAKEFEPKKERRSKSIVILDMHSSLGQSYWRAMKLAGKYAYAGRDWVIDRVLRILEAKSTFEVHNHHNFAWNEEHDGEQFVVVRKGATPARPGQYGFIGSNMCDNSYIVRGVESHRSREGLYTTVHGAGRVMSRTKALGGRYGWKDGKVTFKKKHEPAITPEAHRARIEASGIELRGGGRDESPGVYKLLRDVLDAHAGTIEILHELTPIGVAMAGVGEKDPYKD